jgi:ligand-binding SRPBCC domain-containing protein
MHTFTTSQWVPFPIELVFAFFANPANLPHLTPKWQQARLESSRILPPPVRPVADNPSHRFQSPAAGAGSELVISMRVIRGLPIRANWLVRISEFVWNDHFQDELLKGPFAHWLHTHRIVREEQASPDGITSDGTRITDELEYELPLGPLGSIAHSLYVRHQIASTFAFRQQRLAEILPVASRQAARKQ